jgi:antitoxin component YwqK of YwqJK toxin-antitoxin module
MKNMVWRCILTVLTSIIVFSCGDKAKLKVDKYPNGNIKEEAYYLNDSIKHGLYKDYYVNGNINSEIYFVQNKMNGPAKYYYPDGKLKSELYYVDDLLEGEGKWYYDNGQLESKSFSIQGREYGSTYFYNAQGQLELYQCIDFNDDAMYILKFDEAGNVIKEEGVVFSPAIKVLPEDTAALIVGKPLRFLITAAEPHGYSTSIWTRDFIDGKIKNREQYPIKNSTVTVEKIYSHAGEQGLIVIGEMRNQSNDLILRDSIIKVVHIKDTKPKFP